MIAVEAMSYSLRDRFFNWCNSERLYMLVFTLFPSLDHMQITNCIQQSHERVAIMHTGPYFVFRHLRKKVIISGPVYRTHPKL